MKGSSSMMDEPSVIRIPPYHFIHVLDQTSNVTRVEIGPQTFVRKDNEQVYITFLLGLGRISRISGSAGLRQAVPD